MTDAAELAQKLQARLAPALGSTATALADLLLAVVEGRATPDDLARQIAEIPNGALALLGLAGEQVAVADKLLDFNGAQTGDILIGDVAGGSITKVQLNLIVQLHQSPHAANPGAVQVISDSVGADSRSPLALAGGNSNYGFQMPGASADHPLPSLSAGCEVFVSAGGTESPALNALVRLLRLRGLRVRRPSQLEASTQTRLEEALASADAAVVFLSPESCGSADLRAVELPAIWARYARPAPFLVVPILDGVSLEQANQALALPGAQLGAFRALKLPPDDTPERVQELGAIAQLLLERIAGPHLRQTAALNQLATIALFSYPPVGQSRPTTLHIDWVELFPEPDNPTRLPPEATVWEHQLLPALSDVRATLGQSGVAGLQIAGRYHLSAGLAFGFRFRTVASLVLQIAAQPGGVWRSDEQGDTGPKLTQKVIELNPAGDEVSIEVGLSRDVSYDVGSYLAGSGLPISRRIQLISGPALRGDAEAARVFVASPAHARRLVTQIANLILTQQKARKIHLFVAIPQAMTILVGARINKARPVQCYEYVSDGRYVPGAVLR